MQGGQLHIPPLTRINKILVIAVVVSFFLTAILSKLDVHLAQVLGLSFTAFKEGHLYQLFTYPLVGSSLMSVLFECLLIWFLGSELELAFGPKKYTQYLVVSLLGAGFTFLVLAAFTGGTGLFAFPLMGIAGIGYALCAAYALTYSERQLTFMLIFPMKAPWFCLIMIGILVYMSFMSAAGGSAIAQLGGMLFAYIFWRKKINPSRSKANPMVQGLWNKMTPGKKKSKAHLYIVNDDDDKKPPTFH